MKTMAKWIRLAPVVIVLIKLCKYFVVLFLFTTFYSEHLSSEHLIWTSRVEVCVAEGMGLGYLLPRG